jgi:hypothetical protein
MSLFATVATPLPCHHPSQLPSNAIECRRCHRMGGGGRWLGVVGVAAAAGGGKWAQKRVGNFDVGTSQHNQVLTLCILCQRHGPIWPKLERQNVLGRHIANMSATFPAKQERTSISRFFGTVPMIPKILGTVKTDPAKAKESLNTKPHSQHSFCQLNFTKILGFIGSVAL